MTERLNAGLGSMSTPGTSGITRREMLKRGLTLTGAVLWTTPVVQTIGMSRAFAQTASPCEPGVSFIAVNVSYEKSGDTDLVAIYFKYEFENGEWIEDSGTGQVETQCPDFKPAGTTEEPEGLVVEVTGDDQLATVTITSQPNDSSLSCVIDQVAVKGGTCCDVIPGEGRTQITVTCPTQNCD